MRTKQTSKRIRTVRRHRLALALVGAMAMPVAMAQQALPNGGSVVGGDANATISYSGNSVIVNQSTKGAIINWGSFDIGSGYGATFNNTNFGSSSVTLNRVVGFGYGPSQSVISGGISAAGHVFIVNTAGVVFNNSGTGTDQINVGGLVASTIDISDANFNVGVVSNRYVFNGASGASGVQNDGVITAATGGRVAFLGTSLQNYGNISANDGSVAFGAASSVTLDFLGDGLTQVTLNGLAASTVLTDITNRGTITADGGQILMRALANSGGTGGDIHVAGMLQARSLVNDNTGRVELTSEGGDVVVAAEAPVVILFAPAPVDGVPGAIDVSGGANGRGGTVDISGDDVLLYRNPTSGLASSIDASGGTGGGTVNITAANDIELQLGTSVSAASSGGAGGSISIEAGNALVAYGSLSAGGASAGGSIVTSTAGLFDIRGLVVDAGSPGGAGTWTLWAPDINVVDGNATGGPPALGQDVQDADINNALDAGTNVTLRAGVAPTDGGYIYFADGVDIFYDDGTVPLLFRADANAAITGSNFSIASNDAPLSMAFNADAANLSYGFAGISFTGATLDSNGGDILFYGQSDSAAGMASSYDTGVELSGSTIVSNGGNVLLRGASTGGDAGPDDAGVVLDGTSIDAGSGAVVIQGTGEGVTHGVIVAYSDIAAGIGGVTIDGQSVEANGVYAYGSGIVATGGDISLNGIGGAYGVYFDGDLYSHGGDIVVHGEGGTYDGIAFSGSVDSAGGDITMYGLSTDATGLAFGGGYNDGIISVGGDIALTGIGATGGVALHEGGGALFAPSDAGEIDSAGGDITVTGTASAAGGIGVYSDGIDLVGWAGDVTVTGTAPLGTGILLVGGAGVSTTTGAIALTGTGADFGLDLAYAAIDTDSGDISLSGYSDGTGVEAGAGGLYSGGGDINVHGEGGSGPGVHIAGPVDSGGGDITMYGLSTDAIGLEFGGGYYSGMISGGGDIALTGIGATQGVALLESSYALGFAASDVDTINSGGGDIAITGTASAADGIGVYAYGVDVIGGAGDVTVTGTAPLGTGILFAGGAGVATTTGAIALIGTGANFGLDIADGAIDTDSGDITLTGDALAATATAGVRVTGGGLGTNGGAITVTGTSAGGVGVQLGDGGAFAIGSGGGAIGITGSGVNLGVMMWNNQVDSAGGDIAIVGNASGNGAGALLSATSISSGAGDVGVTGTAPNGVGVRFEGGSSIATTSGGIAMTGIGGGQGVGMSGGGLNTGSGHIDVRGRGGIGLVVGGGVGIVTNTGGISLSGEGGSSAGLLIQPTSGVDGGDSMVVLRAGNDGSSDAIRILSTISSSMGVNLRPGGVDAGGGLTDRVSDEILVGGGTAGFALDGTELAMIDAPQVIIGSNLHAGAIRVLGATSRDGNLTLQNDGGSGGIDIQAALDVGDGVLALSSGGDIVQGAAGAITAHSLLASAGGDVLLAEANNNVAATTLAGSAGGDFEYQDVDALAIGSVSAAGFDANSNGLSSLGANGIVAGGNVFVRNLAGDMTLNAGVSGVNIDLVTANTLQNLAGASLVASGDWRVWANTWVGETRGGLAGNGDLPNLYGCNYLGACVVTVPTADDHFIYVQQPTALISIADATREYGLPNPAFAYTVSGAILGDSLANLATGTPTTTATIGSDVGQYAITGSEVTFTSNAGYLFQFDPGVLAITPATLLFTADNFVRYLGTENPLFTGIVTGFRNGDTIESVFGSAPVWSSPAGILSPIGFYPVNGGTSARNYVFAQAPGNATALQVIPLPQLSSTPIDLIRETVDTYVYDRNFGSAPMCALNASLDDQQLASTGDELSNEWSKVRSRPNLTNCFDSERGNSCGDF